MVGIIKRKELKLKSFDVAVARSPKKAKTETVLNRISEVNGLFASSPCHPSKGSTCSARWQ